MSPLRRLLGNMRSRLRGSSSSCRGPVAVSSGDVVVRPNRDRHTVVSTVFHYPRRSTGETMPPVLDFTSRLRPNHEQPDRTGTADGVALLVGVHAGLAMA